MNFFYIIFALLGFGFLVFIHELGHYIVARRQGIAIEIFSIGFGKALYSWQYQGVKWQICMVPLGGYVMFRGSDEKKGESMYDVKDGFFAKSPWARIKVLLAGPLVNIGFALIAFTMVWALNGRMKPFEQYTKIIGSVDQNSDLAQLGVGAGDTIDQYNGHQYNGFADLIYQGILKNETMQVSGQKINYFTGIETPFNYRLPPYHKEHDMKDLMTIGISSPASVILFKGFDTTLGKYSPLWDSGIEDGDRIVWANGDIVFSTDQLKQIINQKSVVLTVRQDEELKMMRVPRVAIADLELSKNEKGEFSDWRHAIGEHAKVEELGFIPYEIDQNGYVKGEYSFIDDDIETAVDNVEFTQLFEGDQILAIGDQSVDSGLSIFKALAKQDVMMIVKKNGKIAGDLTWENQDELFKESIDWDSVKTLAATIGTNELKTELGDYKIIGPVTATTFGNFYKSAGESEPPIAAETRKKLDLENSEFLFLGSKLSNEMVVYNPTPLVLMKDGAVGTWRTLSSLFTGNLSPKWLSGPVGMFKIMHDGWSVGPKEVLFWMGLISLNLGLFNLLPLPILDGGRIVLSVWEWVTKKRISEKAMEVILLPFFVLLVAVFIYTTYHDLARLIGG